MNYDKEGKLRFKRKETNRRVIFKEDLIMCLEENNLIYIEQGGKNDILYVRVSSQEQKTKGDLDRQVIYLLENIQNLRNPLVLKELGSGLNDNRAKLNIRKSGFNGNVKDKDIERKE